MYLEDFLSKNEGTSETEGLLFWFRKGSHRAREIAVSNSVQT